MYDCSLTFPVNLAINPERPHIQQLYKTDFWLRMGPSAMMGYQTDTDRGGIFSLLQKLAKRIYVHQNFMTLSTNYWLV